MGQTRRFDRAPITSGLPLPAQPVDATQALHLSAGVANVASIASVKGEILLGQSFAATAPTLPRQTSATIRSKPARATPPAAERPRSSSTVSMRDQPSAVRRSRIAYCKALLSRLWRT